MCAYACVCACVCACVYMYYIYVGLIHMYVFNACAQTYASHVEYCIKELIKYYNFYFYLSINL